MSEVIHDPYENDGASLGPLAHGQLCYLQIPATDIGQSASFYGAVFGWQVSPPDAGFEAPGLIGQWVGDRPPAPDGGLMGWIFVDDIDQTVQHTVDHGGRVLTLPEPDGPVRWLSTIADPAGNVVGVVSHGRR